MKDKTILQLFMERNKKNFEVLGQAAQDYRIIGEVALFCVAAYLTYKEGQSNIPTPFLPKSARRNP